MADFILFEKLSNNFYNQFSAQGSKVLIVTGTFFLTKTFRLYIHSTCTTVIE